MASRTITVYRDAPGGKVEKFDVFRQKDGIVETINEAALRPASVCDESRFNYHERIKRTYYDLECAGKLNDMSPRTKSFVRDVHTHAQNPAYWPEGE